MILFHDTETTGFPNRNLPLDHPDQPHLVQLACLLTEDDGTERASLSLIVDPGVLIPERTSAVHGVTDDIALRFGVSPQAAVRMWSLLASRAGLVVAHNAPFDWAVMQTAWARSQRHAFAQAHGDRKLFCTMEAATPVLSLPPTEKMRAAGFTKPKAPRLEECIQHMFGETLDGAHDALVDVRACARVFFQLRRLEAAAA